MKALRYLAYAYLCCHAFVSIAQDPSGSLVEKLSELSELYENGFITEDEFLSAKNLLLSNSENTLTELSKIVQTDTDSNFSLENVDSAVEDKGNSNNTTGYGVVTKDSKLKIHGAIDSEKNTITTQLIIQGRLVKIDTLSTSENVLSGALGLASSIALGVDLSSLATNALIDDENYSYLEMNEAVTEEVVRVAECSAVERNREIISVHLVPSDSAYNSPNGWDGYDDMERYWEDYLELNDSWEIEEGTDEVIWLFYNLFVAGEFYETNINELPIIAASGFVMTESKGERTDLRHARPINTGDGFFKNKVFGKLLNELIPQYKPELPHPDCGLKSEIYLKLQNEISEESELSDLNSFFETLNINYKRDRSKRSLLGIHRTEERSDRIEYPVKIELFYTRRPRTFDRDSISYVID